MDDILAVGPNGWTHLHARPFVLLLAVPQDARLDVIVAHLNPHRFTPPDLCNVQWRNLVPLEPGEDGEGLLVLFQAV